MNIDEIEKFDPQKMYEVYDNWAIFARDAYEKELPKIHFEDIDHIVLAGMGGSGAIGDIIEAILSRENFHVSTVKGYLLPKTVDSKTLVIAISISGNTKETLSILDYSSNSDAKFIAISSGGQMVEKCKDLLIPHYNISMNHSPRASFGIFLYSILNMLDEALPIQKGEVAESLEKMKKIQEKINSKNLGDDNSALNLAKKINSNPLIYFPDGLKAAAIRFKNSLQENAKIHAMVEDIIESSHNGIVSWERPSDVKPILITINGGRFTGYSKVLGKNGAAANMANWYYKEDYNSILDYITNETESFLDSYQILCHNLPLLKQILKQRSETSEEMHDLR